MSKAHKQTYNLAKGMTHIKLAVGYFEHIYTSKDVSHRPKQIVKMVLGRLNGAINDIKFNIGVESVELLDKELESDIFVFEAIKEKLLHLDEKQRWEVESYIDKMIAKTKKHE